MNKGNCILGEILIMIIQQIYNNNVVLVLDENIKKRINTNRMWDWVSKKERSRNR